MTASTFAQYAPTGTTLMQSVVTCSPAVEPEDRHDTLDRLRKALYQWPGEVNRLALLHEPLIRSMLKSRSSLIASSSFEDVFQEAMIGAMKGIAAWLYSDRTLKVTTFIGRGVLYQTGNQAHRYTGSVRVPRERVIVNAETNCDNVAPIRAMGVSLEDEDMDEAVLGVTEDVHDGFESIYDCFLTVVKNKIEEKKAVKMFSLRHRSGMTLEEIGQKLKVSKQYVAQVLTRCHDVIREVYQHEFAAS